MSSSTLLSFAAISILMVAFVIILACILLKKKKPGSPGSASSPSSGAGGPVGAAVTNGTGGKTNVSTFGNPGDGDNGEGFLGVDLMKLGNHGLTFKGKKLIPVAVFMGDGASYLYKILEVKAEGLPPFYGLVADVCDSSQGVCKTNRSKNGLNFLIDIHYTGWKQLGLSDAAGEEYLKTGEFKVIGELRPKDLPAGTWTAKVQSGKEYMACSCKGGCTEKEVVWKPLRECT